MRVHRAQKVALHHPATAAILKQDREPKSVRPRPKHGNKNTGIQSGSIVAKVAPTNPTRREGSQRKKSYQKRMNNNQRISKTAPPIQTGRRRSSSMKIRSKETTSGTEKRTEDLKNE